MLKAPKYDKITIFNDSGKVIEYYNCAMFITGDNLVIVENRHDSFNNEEITESFIHVLSKIKKYKTYKKNDSKKSN